jgi:hypothetical protein
MLYNFYGQMLTHCCYPIFTAAVSLYLQKKYKLNFPILHNGSHSLLSAGGLFSVACIPSE